MIITPKQLRDGKTVSRLGKLAPYMLRVKGEERCTWYMAGNLEGLDRREDAELAVEVMEVLQKGNVRAKGNKTYHLVISFHPEDRRLAPAELEDVVRWAVTAAGLGEHQYVAHREFLSVGASDDRRRRGTRLSGWLRAAERVGSQHSPDGRRGTISGTYCSVTGPGLRREALGEVSAT